MTRTRTRIPAHYATKTTLEIRADNLPDGVCGRVQGIALVYNVVDAWGTRFAPGCLDRTKREKLAAGKIALYCDHEYGTRTHIGVVRALDTVGDTEVMSADIFDTEDGRRAKEYLSAVTAASAQTGLSIGFFDRAGDWTDGDDGRVYEFTECELEEVSITPRPAVPGANVTGVRQTPDQNTLWVALDTIVSALPADEVRARLRTLLGNADTPEDNHDATQDSDDAEETDSHTATMDERLRAVRESYRR